MNASAEEILHLGDSYSRDFEGQKALVGLPCYLESLKLKKIKSLIFKNFLPFCRDSSQKSIPLSRLALLEAEDLVIRRDGDALIAYFDFENQSF